MDRSDFLGRVSIPAVHLLHPPAGGSDTPVTLPLLPLEAPEPGNTALDAIGESHNITPRNGIHTAGDHGPSERALPEVNDGSTSPVKHEAHAHDHHGGVAGRLASRLIGNVQRHIHKDEAITGTLTLSFELLDHDDAVATARKTNKRFLREPRPPREPKGYGAMKFKVAEDAAAAKRRREREGIQVPRMLSRVEVLQRKLGGA